MNIQIFRVVNLLLMLVLIIVASMLVTKRYHYRVDANILAVLQHKAHDLNDEYTRLEIEAGTFSSTVVLGDVARDKLHMISADEAHTIRLDK